MIYDFLQNAWDDVLIETYWNVNEKYCVITFETPDGINRNILECKCLRLLTSLHLLTSINRNILECKCLYHSFAILLL